MNNRIRVLLAGGAMAGILAIAGAPAQATVTLSSGHVDAVDVNWVNNTFSVKILDDTVSPAVQRDPADVTLSVPAGAKTTVPSSSQYSFLGNPGDTIWVLPQQSKSGLLWLGWNATDVPSSVLNNNNMQLKLTAVSGPDDFSAYTVSTFGTVTVWFDSGNGLPDSRTLSAGGHGHVNWAFESAGTYTVTFEVTGVRSSDGAAVSSGSVNYTFVVSN